VLRIGATGTRANGVVRQEKGGTKVARGFFGGAEGLVFQGLQNQLIQSITGQSRNRGRDCVFQAKTGLL